MSQSFIGRWGFIIAGALFMIGGLVPLLDEGKTNVALFVIGLALLVIGARIAKKNREPW
jgi:dipeptide/tripeptide permease